MLRDEDLTSREPAATGHCGENCFARQASRRSHRQTPSDLGPRCLASGPTPLSKEGVGQPSRMGFYSF